MADFSPVFTLATPGGTVLLNDPSQSSSGLDQIYITDATGLDQAPIRAPQDEVPFGDGGLAFNFWKGARHILFDGIFLIQSTRTMNNILAIRNTFQNDLLTALESIAAGIAATGTLQWTPYGGSSRTLTVRAEVALECGHEQDFLLANFHFGLVAPDPDWV